MDALLDEMYKDALIMEDIHCMFQEAALCNGSRTAFYWNKISKRLKSFVERFAETDMEGARELLNCWERAGKGQKDFRQLCVNIERYLLPAVDKAFKKKYRSMEVQLENWIFQTSDALFFTVKNRETNRYLHSISDPMREAYTLAGGLYRNGMEEFHILGVGLGYLPYQIWERSKHTIDIYIYEENKTLLQMAFQLGVLSWINEESLHIVEETLTEALLERFIERIKSYEYGHYISDYKVGAYDNLESGELINHIDYNMRTERICKSFWEINRHMNERRSFKDVSQLLIDFDFEGKPCAVISAGPSLNDNIDFLKKYRDTLIIIVINAALSRVFAEGIRPDIVVVLDPTSELERHIEGIEEQTDGIPLIMPLIGSYAFAKRFRGPVYIVPEKEGDKTDEYLWSYGGTVASLGVDIAFFLKSSKVYLIGSDLAYSGGKNYADNLPHDTDEGIGGTQEEIWVPSVNGDLVQTNLLYNKYREIIENQIRIHSDIPVINLAKGGADIKGTVKDI